MKLTRFLSATASFAIIGAMVPQAAFAQAAPQAATDAEAGDTIIVTGSRIARPNDASTVPITTVTPTDIVSSGRISIGDVLSDLPQLRSSLSSQNSTSGLGTRGLNFLDLRGLGRQRTLVLVNGRRQTSGDIINGAFGSAGAAVDINTFPTDLIDRIDIVTGGNSSIYGSDAVAGVVNFILKRDYDGIQIRGQAGVSKYNDAGNQLLSVVAGKNFADGRGNIAINLEYASQSDYYGSNRPNIAQNDAFLVVDTDPAGAVNGSDGIPDRIFFRDIRSSTLARGGQVGIQNPVTGNRCGLDPIGGAYTCGFLFQPDGTLIPQTGLRVAVGPNGSFIGGNGENLRDGIQLVLSPNIRRYGVNVIGHFEVTPAFVPFVEAKYVRVDAFGSQSGPFFQQGQTLGDGITVAGLNDRSYVSNVTANGTVNREGIRLDNPYLSAQARTLLTTQITQSLAAGINPNTGGAISGANLALAQAQVAAGTFRFSNRKNWEEFPTRDEQFRRETYRIVAGIRGDFNDDWSYELSANYSEHKERNNITGNINRQRFLLASDTVLDNGVIRCRSQVDPAYAGTDRGGNPAQLAADIAACVPLNPFGYGSASQAARNYLLMNTQADGKSTQFVASGFVSGDLSQLFELPGGPIGFSVGAEYRKESLAYNLDALTRAGYAFYNALSPFNSSGFEVKEAFGEVRIPLLKDIPLFRELTFSGSGRVADYRGNVGTVFAYSGGVDWKPIDDLRLRGTYSRSVRSPYLGQLFAAPSQNFAPAPNDPCSARNLAAGSSTRAANCDAAGRPAGYDFVYTSSLEIRGGGNPNLTAEKSTSWTLGGVYQPSYVPGLTLSVDYYNIKVNQTISSVTAQNILNLCYDSATLNNPFCNLFQRAGAGGGPRGEQPFRVLESSLLASSANFAALTARGIDTNINYNGRFNWGQLNLRGVWTHVFNRSNFTNPADPTFENVLIEELGDPRDAFNVSADVKVGKLTVGYTFRWIGKQYLNTFEDYNRVNNQNPQNTDYAEVVQYPIVTYSDIRVAYDVTDKLELYLGVNNIGDTKPPFGLTGIGAGSGIYDNRGRYMFAGFVAKL